MISNIKEIERKILSLETEVGDLRQGYLIINRRYSQALTALKELTAHAAEAAKRAANGAIKAAAAAKNASTAATEAAAFLVVVAADAAADAAAAAAESARRWLRGLAIPELDKLLVLRYWLNIDLNALGMPKVDTAHQATMPLSEILQTRQEKYLRATESINRSLQELTSEFERLTKTLVNQN